MTPSSEGKSVGPRALLAWLIASACLFFQFVVQIQPSAMVEELEKSFQADSVEIGLLSSAYFITYIVLQAPMGWLLDRFGPRLILGVSMILGALALLWFGFATTLVSATTARVVLGIAGGPAFAAAALVASRGFPASRFALMLGLTEAFTLLGGIAVTLGLPHLEAVTSRGGSGVVLAVLSGLLALACFLFVGGRSPESAKKRVASEGSASRAPSILSTLLEVRLWLAGLHAGLFFGIISAFAGLWAAPFFRARFDLAPETATYPVAVLFAAGVLGAPLLGLISGLRRWRGPTLLVASLACTLATAITIFAPFGMAVILINVAVLGFFSGVFAVDLACIQDAVAPARRGLAMGTANMVLGVVGGPLMLMVIAGALDGASSGGAVAPMNATLEQMREALTWFVGAIALSIPIGIVLVWSLKSRVRHQDSMG